MASQETKVEAEFCYDWAFGNCKFGSACFRAAMHHPKLDPALQDSKGNMLSTAPMAACQRCLQNLLACDKRLHRADDDPCSECRHFGGAKVRCRLENKSYNDAAWDMMMKRGRDNDPDKFFTLPTYDPNKSRGDDRDMDVNVKQDWHGKTKEELRALPDMLSAEQRALPRAYVVPPKKKPAWNPPDQTKRKASSISSADTPTPAAPSPRPSAIPTFPPPPRMPPPDANHGRCIRISYWAPENRWTYLYEDGMEISGLASESSLSSEDLKYAQSKPASVPMHPNKRQRFEPARDQ